MQVVFLLNSLIVPSFPGITTGADTKASDTGVTCVQIWLSPRGKSRKLKDLRDFVLRFFWLTINFVIFYTVTEDNHIVTIIRIVYGGRDIKEITSEMPHIVP